MTEMLWQGRFGEPPDDMLLRFSRSIDVDIRLLGYDLAVTHAHCHALVDAGLLTGEDLDRVEEACDFLLEQWHAGAIDIEPADEDVHSLVERLLTKSLGELGRRIHAGRSRNDLVATDFRLWCKDAATSLAAELHLLIDELGAIAESNTETVMPGVTHLQHAQPVTLGFHLAAHCFALARDVQRLKWAAKQADVSPLGAGALAGSTLGLNPQIAADHLGFGAIFDNAMDAVSDRDFACDLCYAVAICAIHLSRIAEELVLWTTPEFGYARIGESWTTGSSMMPQKQNPDVAELTRARSGAAIGDLMTLMAVLKGLPLSYNRDLQEDKAPTFAAADRLGACIEAMRHALRSVSFDRDRLEEAAAVGDTWATDLAEKLVRQGTPFREAHAAVGRLVALLEEAGTGIQDAPDEVFARAHPSLRPEDRAVGNPRRIVEGRDGWGSTSPARVKEQLDLLRGSPESDRRG